MSRRLPPLNGLRSFEAAARNLSFTKAASELNVTQAAVSHQVKGLEERLGVQLFKRVNRGLLLTDGGQEYLRAVRESFDRIAEATDRLVATEATRGLRVSAPVSFGAKWLVPRLYRFQERHPEIEVWISTGDSLVDLSRDPFDVAIRYTDTVAPELHKVRLFVDHFLPVCSPKVLQENPDIQNPADLKNAFLLFDEIAALGLQSEGGRQLWRLWFEKAGIKNFVPKRGMGFSHSNLQVQMAAEGRGIALVRYSLAMEDLMSGRLVQLFDITLEDVWTYFVVSTPATATRSNVVAFREWLIEEAEQTVADSNTAPGARMRDTDALF